MGTVRSSKQLHRSALPLAEIRRGCSLHLPFLYLPLAPLTTTNTSGKPKYLPLSLGMQADTKTRG